MKQERRKGLEQQEYIRYADFMTKVELKNSEGNDNLFNKQDRQK